MHKFLLKNGCLLFRGFLDRRGQKALLSDIRGVLADAPLFRPQMPRTGKPFSVMMSNCGKFGWLSDKERGYRYERVHPETGTPWPAMPPALIAAWDTLAECPLPPEVCLVNYYGAEAKLGLHRDEDERDFSAPILSLSLGDTAIFQLGGLNRRDKAMRVELQSGDALIMGGEARLCYHGVTRVLAGSSSLLAEGGRFNLTVRHVGAP